MMLRTVLTVNTGSSSVRLAAFAIHESGPRQLASAHITSPTAGPEQLLRAFLDEHNLTHIDAVAHRIVHGGTDFTHSTLLDAAAEAKIRALSNLAPLHNPRALRWLAACHSVLGTQVPQVGVFDTAWYANLPAAASTYALPAALCRKHGVRRFGFHGLAHESMWRTWCRLRPDSANDGRVISLQLGSGCSATAVKQGVPQDTSMGFSPLEGLVMATRCGDLDAGLLLHLQQAEGLSPEDCETLLNHSSGLLGISKISGDMRTLLDSKDPQAALAIDMYVARIRKYIGAYMAVLGGVDAILIGGGVGENSPLIRQRILAGFEWCGLVLDSAANTGSGTGGRSPETCISAPQSSIAVWVLPVDEAQTLVTEALRCIHRNHSSGVGN